MDGCLDLFHLQSWWQRLTELLGLFTVLNDQGVEVTGAANLELGAVLVLLDLDRLGVLSAGGQKKVLDLLDFLRHFAALIQ